MGLDKGGSVQMLEVIRKLEGDSEAISQHEAIGAIVELPKIADPRGNLTFIEGGRHVPFEIKRVYWTYDVPGGEVRGGHAHKNCETFIIAASGSFDVILDNGRARSSHFLNRSYRGLLVPRMTWREIENFSSGSVCLVLASDLYDESDYYRDYQTFLEAVRVQGQLGLHPLT
jgi:hypothetical protein